MSVESFAAQIKKFDVYKTIASILKKKEVSDYITFIIINRLYTKGIDGNEKELQTDRSIEEGLGYKYASSTIFETKPPGRFRGKIQRHQKYSNVTLSSDGGFYNSFKVIVKERIFEIKAEFEKSGGHMYNNFTKSYKSEADFEDSIEKLVNDKELFKIAEYIYPEFEKRLNEVF